MARAKNKKTNRKKRYGQDMEAHHRRSEGDEHDDDWGHGDGGDGGDDDEPTHRVPPELAPYALTRSSDIPPALRKYWRQRNVLFSYFDGSSPTGMLPLLDEQSWFSVTPEPIAARISQRCKSNVVLDAFCGAGGNAIQFAFTCQHVLAIDVDPIKLLLAKHNAKVYGVEERITFLQGDWREFVADWVQAREEDGSHKGSSRWMGCEKWDIDVVFLSPPWGGVEYRQQQSPAKSATPPERHDQYDHYPLSRLEPSGGADMYELARKMTSSICMYLPRTIDLHEVASLVGSADRTTQGTFVNIEEQWLGNRCKALACYFGPLVEGSES